MKVIGILPARLNSSRIKEKLLHKIHGVPLILHTISRAKLSKSLNSIFVCTDSRKISDVVENSVKTYISRKKHSNGTERIAELANKTRADLIIDIHADEAVLNPKNIDKLVSFHKKNRNFDIVVPHKVSKFSGGKNVVKLLANKYKEVLYFTRCDAPFGYKKKNIKYLHHLDTISFKPAALKKFAKLKKGNLEIIEGIELMRALENNLSVGTFEIKTNSFSVNTPQDLFKAKKIIKKDRRFKYFNEKNK